MKTEYRPISMRCTQEQFDSIKDRIPLTILHSCDFDKFPYLINCYDNQMAVGNSLVWCDEDHQTFDGELFLDCCGSGKDETRYVNTTELDEVFGGILFILEKMPLNNKVSAQKCAYELEQLFYKTLDAKKDVIIKEYLKDKVWSGRELQSRYDHKYGLWHNMYPDNQYRIKPQPDYSKEIEALENNAKENGKK